VVNLDRGGSGASQANGARSWPAGRHSPSETTFIALPHCTTTGAPPARRFPPHCPCQLEGTSLLCSVVQPSCRRRACGNLRRSLSKRGPERPTLPARRRGCRHVGTRRDVGSAHAPSGDGAQGPGRRSGGGALASSLLPGWYV